MRFFNFERDRSHVCWHVYGLLHRADHDYNEAIKAYKQALRVDPQNLQILRDLSMLQIQMRDLHGFATTRNTLLTLKPNAKINWMAFALARHLSGDLLGAAKVIDIYLGTLSEGSAELGRCFESSELAMYKNSILGEIPNNFKEALDHLTACEAITVDRTNWLIKRAEYQLKLKDYSACLKTIHHLFERGSTENYRIHSIVMCALLKLDESFCDESMRLKGTQTLATMIPLTDDQKKILLDMYLNTLKYTFPQSVAIQRIPLSLLNEQEFQQAIELICRRDLRKGVPSLCSELKSFLWTTKNGRYVAIIDPADVKNHARFKMFVTIVEAYISSLISTSKFSATEDEEEPPSTILWTWFLRAGLHELAGEYKEGLELLEKCLEHSPTEVDIYELKARLLKAIGNIDGAVECLDKGRDLDRQDRYINNQTTKYMLQAGMEEESLKRISLFTRHEGHVEQNLYDMQCSWYELELAQCLVHKEDWGRSLKKYCKSRTSK
jgi:N-alpha-acetyltransferase 15/16, NatA auxiliary subunit